MKAVLSFLLSISIFLIGVQYNYAQFYTQNTSAKNTSKIRVVKTQNQNDSLHRSTNGIHQSLTEVDSKNFVKMNLTSIALRNFSFQYERALTTKISGALGFRVMPKGNLPLKNLIKNIVDDDEAWLHIEQIKTSNFAITPELRFYMGKSIFRGFYIAPFARFASYSVDMPFDFEVHIKNPNDPSDQTIYGTVKENIPLSGKISSITGGVLFGAQWKVAEKVYLDWWILGPHYGSTSGDITGNKILTQEEREALRDNLSDLEDISFINGSPEVNANGARVNVKGPWGGVRAGLSLGYRF